MVYWLWRTPLHSQLSRIPWPLRQPKSASAWAAVGGIHTTRTARQRAGLCHAAIDMTAAPLISSQRYRCQKTVARKAATFKVFVVNVIEITLRGQRYRVLADGHHNLAAAKLIGAAPTWRGAPKKLQRVMQQTPPDDFARFLINNLTDADWYYVDTGRVVPELLGRA